MICAGEAIWQLELDRILLMPTGEPPHKAIEGSVPGRVRLEMAALAAAGQERLEASAIEVEREGPSYTHETLEQLHDERPDDELFFVMGADQAASLERWRHPERVGELARLAIAGRQGVDRTTVEQALERVGCRENARFFEMPEIAISSSMIRDRAAAGRPFRHLVPDVVGEMIERKGLYA